MVYEIYFIEYTKKFKQDYKGLKIDIRNQVNKVLEDLLKKPMPGNIHIKKYNGHSNPNIYAIHVTSNHSHKISFEL
ncbi:hypothetical protein C8R27_11343 [Nitrosomonas ureae]|nr:hypothetical protein C8R27_11343 [Nitrosomonas ureae]